MKCLNCGVEVGKEFVFAIKNNTCPACGKCIMKADQMGSYLSLCELLKSLMQEPIVEKVATMIMANFELKQTFKVPEEIKSPKPVTVDITALTQAEMLAPPAEETKTEEDEVIVEDGIRLEVIDKKKSQTVLQQMRDEALSGAIGDRYRIDVGGDDEVLLAEDPRANVVLVAREQKRANAQRLVADGVGATGKNGFRRSM